MRSFLLLVLLPLASAIFPGEKCGGFICLNSTSHEVNCKNGQCYCNEGYYGNGRFACVDKSKACVCYLYGDPHVTAFSEAIMSAQIPCRIILAEFTTPTGVYVKVAGQGKEGPGDFPGYTFIDEIFFNAVSGKTEAHANIRRKGFFNKGLHIPTPVQENFPNIGLTVYGENESHYWRLELPRHHVIIRYRSADSSLTVQTPRGSQSTGDRPCGDCADSKGKYVKAAASANLSIKEWSLLTTIKSLDVEKEEDQTCLDLSKAATTCPEDNLAAAVQFCGAPYNAKDIGTCYLAAYGERKSDLLVAMSKCITQFCNGDLITVCEEARRVIASCGAKIENADVINNVCNKVPPPPPKGVLPEVV